MRASVIKGEHDLVNHAYFKKEEEFYELHINDTAAKMSLSCGLFNKSQLEKYLHDQKNHFDLPFTTFLTDVINKADNGDYILFWNGKEGVKL